MFYLIQLTPRKGIRNVLCNRFYREKDEQFIFISPLNKYEMEISSYAIGLVPQGKRAFWTLGKS